MNNNHYPISLGLSLGYYPTPEAIMENLFVGYGITCGKIGYERLISGKWYQDNKEKIDSYIIDYKTKDEIKIIAVPKSIIKIKEFYPRGKPRVFDWNDLKIENPNMVESDVLFLKQIINECRHNSNALNIKWWIFGYDSNNIKRMEIVNIPFYKQDTNKMLQTNANLNKDVNTIILSYCEMSNNIPNDKSNYW